MPAFFQCRHDALPIVGQAAGPVEINILGIVGQVLETPKALDMAVRQKEHRLVGQQRAVALDHALGKHPDRLAIPCSLQESLSPLAPVFNVAVVPVIADHATVENTADDRFGADHDITGAHPVALLDRFEMGRFGKVFHHDVQSIRDDRRVDLRVLTTIAQGIAQEDHGVGNAVMTVVVASKH